MQHLIIGYGYCGFYLANHLLETTSQVTVIARQPKPVSLHPRLTYLTADITQYPLNKYQNAIVYYFIPPSSTGRHDLIMAQFLAIHQHLKPIKALYFSSSGVYGDHHGHWINEQAHCHLAHDRQYRRLDAEQQWIKAWPDSTKIILRISGIYGPKRLPIAAAKASLPIIIPPDAPYINHIYVKDLVRIAALLALNPGSQGIYNIADGKPEKMGSLQQQVAHALNILPAPTQSAQDHALQASAMKLEFMSNSKRLCIDHLQQVLNNTCLFTPKTEAIAESLQETPIID